MNDLSQRQPHTTALLQDPFCTTSSDFLNRLPVTSFAAGTHQVTVPQIESIDDANMLVKAIYDPERYVPLLLVTSASDTGAPRVDVAALVKSIRGTADVVIVPNAFMAWRLKERLPEAFNTYGGAVRLWWPSADPGDPYDRHPLFLIMREEQSIGAIANIIRTLDKYGYGVPNPGAHGVRHPRGLHPVVPAETVLPDTDRDAEIERLHADLRRAEDRATAATMESGVLRRQVRSLTDQNERLTQRLHGHAVFTDPEEQFRHEVRLAWLHALNAEDRDRYPLRQFVLGEGFLDTVAATDGVDRERIVSTCVDVLSNRVWEINGRAAHQDRVAGRETLIREDGAVAWRCAIQQNAPSARRLMWWEVVGGSVDLSRVAVHDDTTSR